MFDTNGPECEEHDMMPADLREYYPAPEFTYGVDR